MVREGPAEVGCQGDALLEPAFALREDLVLDGLREGGDEFQVADGELVDRILAVGSGGSPRGGEGRQPEPAPNPGDGLPEDSGGPVVGVLLLGEALDELRDGLGLLQGIRGPVLGVLRQEDRQGLPVVPLDDDAGGGLDAEPGERRMAGVAGQERVVVAVGCDDEGLEEPVLLEGSDEVGQLGLRVLATRAGVGGVARESMNGKGDGVRGKSSLVGPAGQASRR